MRIEGSTICITGGNKGLGAEIVKKVIDRASRVFVIDRSEQIFSHEKIAYIRMDLASEKPVGLPCVDILISNLGKNIGPKTVEEMSDKDIKEMVEINIYTHLWFLKNIKFKKIVFISSVLALIGLEKYSLYCASKAFLRILNESIQREKVDSMIVYPYKIDTPMFQEINDFCTLKAEKVAECVIQGIETDKKELFIPYIFKIALVLKTILPSIIVDVILKLIVKFFYKKSTLKID
ncbi:Protein dhs-3 [Nosema granulosis]|uniref:Protein dhs-3 n=1 Tax=Nosema granulosis TaxID=83296 RepID=A0A9P6H1Q0_9MICR|nr:Protein dhs-3 [Nosema granulosis]